MELLLDIFWERHKSYIAWKQIICAVFLALMTAGLYNYIDIQPDYIEEHMKEQSVPARHSIVLGSLIDIPPLPEADVKESEDKSDLKIMTGEQNQALSYGGFAETDDRNSTENAEPAKKKIKEVKKISPVTAENPEEIEKNSSVRKEDEDESIKHIAEAAPDIPVTDTVTENPDILTGKEENDDSSIEDVKADAEQSGIEQPDTEQSDLEQSDTEQPDDNPVNLREYFSGFMLNEKGHIAGYTDASKFMKDHLVVLPINAACTGIEKNALKGLETEIYEIYIPTNISYIADGAFDDLVNLYYIEAAAGNSRFYSKNGILYYRNGEVAACPRRLRE